MSTHTKTQFSSIVVLQVIKGFLPVDEYGNLVKKEPRAADISIEGMPDVTRESFCRIAFITKVSHTFGWLSVPANMRVDMMVSSEDWTSFSINSRGWKKFL